MMTTRFLLSRSRDSAWRLWGAALAVVSALALGGGACGRSELDPPGSANGGRGGTGVGLGGRGGTGATQLPPTPGLLLCGSTICIAATQQCCLGLGASGLDAQCVRPGTACPGATVQCDEPADCPSSKVCCAGFLSSSGAGTGGAASAGGIAGLSIGSRCETRAGCSGAGELILCRADNDCAAGTVCCPGLGVSTCQASCIAF